MVCLRNISINTLHKGDDDGDDDDDDDDDNNNNNNIVLPLTEGVWFFMVPLTEGWLQDDRNKPAVWMFFPAEYEDNEKCLHELQSVAYIFNDGGV